MRETDLAWAAGFIDGEGCIHIARCTSAKTKHTSYQLVLRVTQRRREPIDELTRIFGGFSSTFHATSYARNRQWVWGCSNKTAANVLTELLPYLVLKRDQATLALEFQEMRVAPKQRTDPQTGRFVALDKEPYEHFYWQMRDLKKAA